ncbi:MAG: hypothetical protein K9J13_06605, partial [Saprospiraceae bacterium]|nr:hypothetical protein [Saprospiraceae bacterium]
MKNFILILISIVIVSCNTRNTTSYYFSDGTKIDSSIHISSIENELRNILKTNNLNSNNLNVYTSLHKQIHTDISKPLASHYDSLVARLYKDDKYEKSYLDSIRKIKQLFNTGIFIIENKTGRVLVYYNSSLNSDQVQKKYPL